MTHVQHRPPVFASCDIGQLAILKPASKEILSRICEKAYILASNPAGFVARVHFSDGDSLVAKAWHRPSQARALRERWVYENSQYLAPVGVPKFWGCGVLRGFETTVLFIEDLGDMTLGRAVATGRCAEESAIDILGRSLFAICRASRGAHIDQLGPLSYRRLGVEANKQLEDLANVMAHDLRSLLRRYYGKSISRRDDETPTALCHGDIHAENVVVGAPNSAEDTHLIDFESAVIARPEYDIAKCIVTSSLISEYAQDRLIRAYTPTIPLDRAHIETWTVFHAVEGWLHAGLREGRDRPLWARRVQWAIKRYAGDI